jgi:hypothetical protein
MLEIERDYYRVCKSLPKILNGISSFTNMASIETCLVLFPRYHFYKVCSKKLQIVVTKIFIRIYFFGRIGMLTKHSKTEFCLA